MSSFSSNRVLACMPGLLAMRCSCLSFPLAREVCTNCPNIQKALASLGPKPECEREPHANSLRCFLVRTKCGVLFVEGDVRLDARAGLTLGRYAGDRDAASVRTPPGEPPVVQDAVESEPVPGPQGLGRRKLNLRRRKFTRAAWRCTKMLSSRLRTLTTVIVEGSFSPSAKHPSTPVRQPEQSPLAPQHCQTT